MAGRTDGFIRRGRADAAAAIKSPKFLIVLIVADCFAAGIGALVPANLDGAALAGLAVLAMTGLVCLLTLLIALARAPFAQRNEAREQVANSKSLREEIGTKLVQQSHGFTSILRASAQRSAAESGRPTPEERTAAEDWQRQFPGSQTRQDEVVADVIERYREPLYVLLDTAAAAGIPTSEDREVLRRLSTIDGAWEMSDRIMVLAQKWAKDALPEGTPPVIISEHLPPIPSKSELLDSLIARGEALLAKAASDDYFAEDLGHEIGAWVNRSREVIPVEHLDLYESLSDDGSTPEARGAEPWNPSAGIERRLQALRGVRSRIGD